MPEPSMPPGRIDVPPWIEHRPPDLVVHVPETGRWRTSWYNPGRYEVNLSTAELIEVLELYRRPHSTQER